MAPAIADPIVTRLRTTARGVTAVDPMNSWVRFRPIADIRAPWDIDARGANRLMNDFEALFSLFGVVFGLIVAEISLKFADAIDNSRVRPLGLLTPALAFLILTDITNFWMFLWGSRAALVISWHLVFTGVVLAIVYFLTASLTFPRTKSDLAHLDDHYWARKRVVAGGILFVNVVVIGALITKTAPAWNDWWFYFYFPSYVVALAGLTLSKARWLDLCCLAWALFVNLSAGSDLLPHSNFGVVTGIVPQHQR